jgi:ABC-type nitrate/sulfonate/bicarbonate transport system substrate-binding protein
MTTRRALVLGALATCVTFAPSPPLAAAETPLTVMVFQGMQNLPILAAQENGYFAKRELKVEVKIAPNSGELREGLAAGRYQIVHGGVDNAIAMAETAKADVAVFMGGDNGWNHLMVQPEIGSYADLRGKTVLVDAPNTAFALVLYKILDKHGLKRGDYQVKEAGATFVRFDAMQKDKANAAAILNVPFTIRAERAGLKSMARAVDEIGPYLSTAGFVMRPWAQAHADVMQRYIQAYVEGLRFVLDPGHKDAAIGLMVDKLKLPGDVAAQAYAVATHPAEGMAKDARFDLEGFRNVLKLRAEILGQWGGTAPAPEKYLDLSYYERALKGL